MSTIRMQHGGVALAALMLAAGALGAPAGAASLSGAPDATAADPSTAVQQIRHRGGFGIYIGPSYGYGYGYYPRRYSYPRYSYYDDGYYYDRPYRRDRRWARERFEHPLGRR
jgi:hypothetical protein